MSPTRRDGGTWGYAVNSNKADAVWRGPWCRAKRLPLTVFNQQSQRWGVRHLTMSGGSSAGSKSAMKSFVEPVMTRSR